MTKEEPEEDYTIFNVRTTNLRCKVCKQKWEEDPPYPYLQTPLRSLPWILGFCVLLGSFIIVINITLFIIDTINPDVFPSTAIAIYMVCLFVFCCLWWIIFFVSNHLLPPKTAEYMSSFVSCYWVFTLTGLMMLILAEIIDKPINSFSVVFAALSIESLLPMMYFYYNWFLETSALNKEIIAHKEL